LIVLHSYDRVVIVNTSFSDEIELGAVLKSDIWCQQIYWFDR